MLSDNINHKIKCTNLCNFISLTENDKWKQSLMNFEKIRDREIYNEQIKNTTYNIKKTATELQKIYINIVKGEVKC